MNMDYETKYKLLKKNVWNIMKELRKMPHDEISGSWADVNGYSIWWSLFQAITMQPEKKDEQKRS